MEKMRYMWGGERMRLRDIPKKDIWVAQKKNKKLKKLKMRERHLVTLAWIKASICEGIYLVSFKKIITIGLRLYCTFTSRVLNGLIEGGFRSSFMYALQFITLNIYFLLDNTYLVKHRAIFNERGHSNYIFKNQ